MAKRPFTSLPLSTWLAEIGLTDAPIEKLADLPGIAMTFMLKRMAAGSKAMDAQAAAEKAKREAAGLLRDTASRALHDRAKRAADAMGFAMNQMQAHDQFLREIDGAVRDCEWRCNQLFSGRRVAVDRIDTGVFDSPTASPIAMLDNGLQEQREVKALYLRERAKLDRLRADQLTKPARERDRDSRRAAHEAAKVEHDEIQAEMLVVENTRWIFE